METNSSPATSVPDLTAHLGYWLRLVSNHVSGAFIRGLRKRQTSAAEWVLLRTLYGKPEATPGQLANSLAMTRGAISKIVDKLDAKGWVAVNPDPEDKRVQLLSLTRKGLRILPELATIADRNDEYFFACLTGQEKATLQRLLSKLADHHEMRDVPIT